MNYRAEAGSKDEPAFGDGGVRAQAAAEVCKAFVDTSGADDDEPLMARWGGARFTDNQRSSVFDHM